MSNNSHRYEYLESTTCLIHDDEKQFISPEALKVIEKHSPLEFYDREKMLKISESDGIQDEINKLIKNLLEYRQEDPKGSNSECMCMDQLTEFISKLDLVDFRKIGIERLLTVPAEKTPEEKQRDKERREELRKIMKEHRRNDPQNRRDLEGDHASI